MLSVMTVKRIRELWSKRDTLIQNRPRQAEQYQLLDQAIQSQHHECIVPVSSLTLSSRREYCILSLSSHTDILAVTIIEELFTEHYAPFFIKSFKPEIMTTLSHSPVTSKILK